MIKKSLLKLAPTFLFFMILTHLFLAQANYENKFADPLANFTPSVCYCRDHNANPNEISCDCDRVKNSDDTYASAAPDDVNYIRAWSGEPGWLRIEKFSSSALPSSMESVYSANLCIEWYVSDAIGTSCTIGIYTGGNWQTIDSTCQDTEAVYCYDITNYITTPSDLDALQINVTYEGDSAVVADRLYIDLVYIEVNYSLEKIPPKWFSQQQSTNEPGIGGKVNLSAYWEDNSALAYAWLATNETGKWENKTIYMISLNGASGWSNFTWQNFSLPAGTIVAWRVYANDSAGNENVTDIMTFEVKPTYLLTNLTFPSPQVYTESNPLLIVQNTTFHIRAKVTCFSEGTNANCGSIVASPRYNSTPISKTESETPFWRLYKIYKIANGTNYIINGGFETGDLTGWIVVPGLQNPQINSTIAHDGSYSFGATGSSSTTDTPNALYWKIVQNASTGFQPVVITDNLYFSMWIYGNDNAEYSYVNVTFGFSDGTTAIIASTLGLWSPSDGVYLGGNPKNGRSTKVLSRIVGFKSSGKIINITIEVRKGQDSYSRYYPTVLIDSIQLFNGTIPLQNASNLVFRFPRSYSTGYLERYNLVDYASKYRGATIKASSYPGTDVTGYDRNLPIYAIDDLAYHESRSSGFDKCWKSDNEGAGAWLNITFPNKVEINKVVLWDLPGINNITSGRIIFDDGSFISFGALPPDGSTGLEINFPSKVTRWIKILFTGVEGIAGLCEVDAYDAKPSDEIYVHVYTFPEPNGIDSYFEIYDTSETFLLHNQTFLGIMGGDIYNVTGIYACGYLDKNKNCELDWLINATGAIGSVWSIDVNFTSSFSQIKENNTASIIVKIVKATKSFNLTLFNDSSNLNEEAIVKLLDKNYNLMYSFSKTHSQPLEFFQNYSLEIIQKITTDNLVLLIHQINVTRNLNLIAQIVENYQNYLPQQVQRISALIAFNDTDLNYSHATIYLPKEDATYNKILHCLNWDWSNSNCTQWEIKSFSDYNAKENSTHVWFNVSKFEAYALGSIPYLEVSLLTPDPTATTNVIQNSTFWVNASVTCRAGDCGEVNGTVRYNSTSSYPDTPIPEDYGAKPFFINETPAYATKSCGTLLEDQTCILSWLINATGAIDSGWKIGVLFNSSLENVKENHTENATIVITSCTVDMTVQFASVEFGTVKPNTRGNNATGNQNNLYNITVNPGSCNLDLYLNATDLINKTYSSIIKVGNLTFNNQTNDYSTSFRLSYAYQLIKSNVPPSTNVTIWFWLDVPPVYAGYYVGNISIKGVLVGEKP